ncbi:hypothetical protein N5079_17185 [Planotetraspora sp. A-T 1434]|uniref:hypothetical protein n=1 Tax=Planotetraspora sp. A-T 1434 TaxID=2979219 RepID=UPI0021C1CAD5|nr:hypothetical protein [Planotetraspora sp. A-T 1434]MCT9931940.1 hypothetical protein [Planotetraspora sp. A-T 1434]
MSPCVRTVKTASGARAVQVVHSSRRGSGQIEHIGSAHDDTELETLKAVARQRLAAGQHELDLGLDDGPAAGGPLEIVSSRMERIEGFMAAHDLPDVTIVADAGMISEANKQMGTGCSPRGVMRSRTRLTIQAAHECQDA